MNKYIRNEFNFPAYLDPKTLKEHSADLHYIEQQIGIKLKDKPNFEGIDFCDVHANGIQIRGRHKVIKGYAFGDQPTIQYDFSNIEEVISEFIEMWNTYDNEKYIQTYIAFLSDGEKYGWD